MPDLHFATLGAAPDAVSPDGGAEIRHILGSPHGDLTHAVCPAGNTSGTHHLPELDEAYFVLAGTGELWRATDHGGEHREAVTGLRPGRWVAMPAGTRFQFRADSDAALVFLVVVLPHWLPGLFHVVDEGRWRPGSGAGAAPATPEADRDDSWLTHDLAQAADYLAPDGSEIRLLGTFARGGLVDCVLPPGRPSSAVRHRSVHEIWFVLEGHGELWRSPPDEEASVVPLWPGVGVDIPVGTSFQFRATGVSPLRLAILTMPRWPGPAEAEPVPGRWLR